MNWYVLYELSKIKQAELLKEAQNRRMTAKRGKKSKTLSPRIFQEVNERDRRLFQRDLKYRKQYTNFRPV